jgi:hypothetical protein
MRIPMSSMRTVAGGAVLALAVLLSACRSNRVPRNGDERSMRTTISVENQDFYDMTVYAVVNSQRNRLGVAPGNHTTELTIPSYLINGVAQLRFVCDPIGGGRTPVTEEINVNPGDQLVMIITPGS